MAQAEMREALLRPAFTTFAASSGCTAENHGARLSSAWARLPFRQTGISEGGEAGGGGGPTGTTCHANRPSASAFRNSRPFTIRLAFFPRTLQLGAIDLSVRFHRKFMYCIG